MRYRLITLAVIGLITTAAMADDDHHDGDDWRSRATIEEKVDNLVEVMPGASNLMLQMGDRYQNLYWAARQGKWKFAEYQAEEMEDLIEHLMITRPNRAETAAVFKDRMYPRIVEASGSGDWETFEAAFRDLREACMQCHTDNDHGFIVLPERPAWATSPVLNLEPELEE